MITEKKMTLEFYRNLGKLFYAIAAVDGTVRPIEIHKLKTLVKEQWLDIDPLEDAFGNDAALHIEVVFDWLVMDGEPNASTCFNDFVRYKDKQKDLFTNEVKKLILKTASTIAYAFSAINKSELILLAKLDMELKKIP
ncbi:MAG: hypothetical protein HKN40_08775 [Winogradskyella sp.]|uniref:hypothetical protein n=1 Tax=Winogradskyella sp. TaxID=1883156 RepID=UPI0017C9EB86|nr:hypothetical protein [Winogradskyella sp.]